MDILLPYGFVLFGVTGAVSLIFALLASALGLGAASEIWSLTRICGYLFLFNAAIYCFYRARLCAMGQEKRIARTRARKRRR